MWTFQMKTLGQNFDKISLMTAPQIEQCTYYFREVELKSMLGKLTLKYVTPTLTKVSQSRLKAPEIQHLDEMFSTDFLSTSDCSLVHQ